MSKRPYTIRTLLKKLKPYDNTETLFYRGNLSDIIKDPDFLTKYDNKIDIFIAAYMMHHNYNPKRLIRSIERGSFRKILEKCGENTHRYMQTFCPEILEEGTPHDEFINYVAQIESGSSDEIKRELENNIKNIQKETYHIIYRLLKPDGLICIADPNGFSQSFNRRIIFDQPNIAIANFTGFRDCLEILYKAGFKNFELWRQIR